MILKYLLFLSAVIYVRSDSDPEEDMETVLSMLMNGESAYYSDENDDDSEPVLSEGQWKCGDCNDLDPSSLIYTEVNDVDSDLRDELQIDTQVGVALPNTKCVIVLGAASSIVKRVSGSCIGDWVTLSVTPAQHFTVNVYGLSVK